MQPHSLMIIINFIYFALLRLDSVFFFSIENERYCCWLFSCHSFLKLKDSLVVFILRSAVWNEMRVGLLIKWKNKKSTKFPSVSIFTFVVSGERLLHKSKYFHNWTLCFANEFIFSVSHIFHSDCDKDFSLYFHFRLFQYLFMRVVRLPLPFSIPYCLHAYAFN